MNRYKDKVCFVTGSTDGKIKNIDKFNLKESDLPLLKDSPKKVDKLSFVQENKPM